MGQGRFGLSNASGQHKDLQQRAIRAIVEISLNEGAGLSIFYPHNVFAFPLGHWFKRTPLD